MILILHLLIIQTTTWVLVPSDTPSGPLLVGITKAALFRGLIHINAVKKLAAEHLMQWQQPFLRYFRASILLVRSWCTSLSVEFPISLTNFRSPLHGGSLVLYSSLWTILILHLLIIQITTWVLVLSDTPSGPLWVGIAMAALFSDLFHINAVRKLATKHLMWWQQPFLRYFRVPSLLYFHDVRPYQWNFLEGHFEQ